MKFQLTILLLFISSFVLGQPSLLKNAAVKLDKAILAKDTGELKKLLHTDLSFGHSNGWVQTKEDVVKDLISGKLAYQRIENKEAKWTVTNKAASLRSITDVSYSLEGKPGELKLHVVQVWLKTGNKWQLFARQSTKL